MRWHSARAGGRRPLPLLRLASANATAPSALQISLFLTLLTLGCAGPSPGTQPDAMSSEAHRREAAEHEREAGEHQRRYDARAKTPDDLARYPQEFEAYNPTAVYLRLARKHRRHARQHLDAAHLLEQFEEEECGAFAPETRAVCPLLGQVDGVEDIPGGVRVHLAKGVPRHAAAAHMRCHLAFARIQGRTGMQECPLYLRGVRVELPPDSEAVDLLIADPLDVEALRARTHGHLEK